MSDAPSNTEAAAEPRSKLRYLLPLGLFVLLLVVLVVGLVRAPEKDIIASPLIGKSAPQFTLPSLSAGRGPVSSEQFKGHWTVVNVWGSWCYVCRIEHPTLLMIHQQTQIPIVGIDWNDDENDARQWLQQLGDPFNADRRRPRRARCHRLGRVRSAREFPGQSERPDCLQAGRRDHSRSLATRILVTHRAFGAHRPARTDRLMSMATRALAAPFVLLLGLLLSTAPALAVDSTPPLPNPGAPTTLPDAHARAAVHAVPERGAGRLGSPAGRSKYAAKCMTWCCRARPNSRCATTWWRAMASSSSISRR